MKRLIAMAVLALTMGAMAQTAPPAQAPDNPGAPGRAPQARRDFRKPPMAFWKDSEVAQKLNLSAQQQQQLETTFTNYKLKLIDQRAAVQREETKLQPLIEADQLDAAKIEAQVNALIAARGQLEKTAAMMGIDIRKVLTTDQWKQLKQMRPMGMGPMGMGMFGGREGMHERREGRGPGRDGAGAPPPPPGGQGGPGGPVAPEPDQD